MRKNYFVMVLLILVLSFTGCEKSSSNIDKYLETGSKIDAVCKDVMPVLHNLPKYESIVYQYSHKSMYVFSSDSVYLVVKYDDKTYQNEKQKLKDKYVFLESSDNTIVPECEFAINSYTFRLVANEEKGDRIHSNDKFPKSFGMIGTSEKEKSIAYLYFYDLDLDYIGQKNDVNPMADFVEDYFDYNF